MKYKMDCKLKLIVFHSLDLTKYKALLWLKCFFILFPLPLLANASDYCDVRIKADRVNITISREQELLFNRIKASLTPDKQKEFIDALDFYIPRLPYAQSRIDDIAYTVSFLEGIDKAAADTSVMMEVVRLFSGDSTQFIANVKFKNLNDLIEKNYPETEPLISHHVDAYFYIRHYGICVTASPWSYFTKFTHLDDKKFAATQSYPITHLRVRPLIGEKPLQKFLYFDNETAPKLQTNILDCSDGHISKTIGLEFDAKRLVWVESPLRIKQGEEGSIDDLYDDMGDKAEERIRRPHFFLNPDKFLARQTQTQAEFVAKHKRISESFSFPDQNDFSCD